MKRKYRIKKQTDRDRNPQHNHSAFQSPVKSKSTHTHQNSQSDDKRFRSQIIKPTYVQSPTKKSKPQSNSSFQKRKTYSKLNIRTGSPELRKQHISLSQIVPQSKSLHLSVELKHSITPKEQNSSQINLKQDIKKFPHYVSKSYQMIETKRKLLEAKHNIKLGKACPILETIEDSVNEDKAAFSRKMKLQLCRKGNYDLIGFLLKDIDDSTQKSINSHSQSKEKQYRARNLPYLLSSQYRDPYVLERQEMVQKMEERKRQLKVVRRNNLSRNTNAK